MFKKFKFKESYIYVITTILLFLFISSIYVFFPTLPNSIDNRLRDYLFTTRGEVPPQSDSLIIIDIDEKSIKSLGQWPWSRDVLSKLLTNLSNLDVGIIGMDIVFAEEDRTSPHKVFDKLNINKKNIPNYDLDFAHTIASTPTILGYQFEFDDNEHINKEAPSIQTIFIEKNKKLGKNYLIQAEGTILNIPVLQDNSYSSGFFNNIPDDSGIIRSVPLVISYDDEIYPSLALETLRIGLQEKRIFINYNEEGIESLQLADIIIPTDRHGRVLINFRGKEKTFKYISALDIYLNKVEKKEVENKIALVGTSAAALMDLRATPFESIFPGVEVHANLIDNIISQDFLYKPSWVYGLNLSIIFILIVLTVLLTKKTPIWLAPLLIIVFLFLTAYSIYFILFNKGIVLNIFFPILTIVLTSIITLIIEYFYEVRKKEDIKNKFASKVSKDVMEQLLSNVNNNKLESTNKEITIFFSDIRDFTKIAEQIPNPKFFTRFINSYMTPMSNIIIKNEGTIDKYIGDSIMAYWNAPFDVKNHEEKAVDSAIEQLYELEELNKTFKKKNKPEIKIGIGITTGIAMVGEIGSIGRSDYTVIGDTVNTGARIESLCKYYGACLIISNKTKDKLPDKYIFRYLDYVQVKGKEDAIELWEVLINSDKNKKEELRLYNKAIELFKNQKLKEAITMFDDLINKSENDNIYKIYKERCTEYIKEGNFKLIYKHINKG